MGAYEKKPNKKKIMETNSKEIQLYIYSKIVLYPKPTTQHNSQHNAAEYAFHINVHAACGSYIYINAYFIRPQYSEQKVK